MHYEDECLPDHPVKPPRQSSTFMRLRAQALCLFLLVSAGSLLMAAGCGPQRTSSPRPAAGPSSEATAQPAHAVVDVRQVRRALTAVEAEDYLGDAVCAACHRTAAADHARSAHARTLRSVGMAQDGA